MDASHEISDDEPQDEESEVSAVEIDAEVDGAVGGERTPREESSALPVPVSSESSLPEATEGRAQATALTAYMSELRHHAPISREEEHELAVQWVEQGDVEAAKMLVVAALSD